MISVVIPALNEENAIADVVSDIRDTLNANGRSEHEIIVVNDGSTDLTADVAEAAGAKVVHHPQNAGYGRSIKDGIYNARGDVIVITDADGTYMASEMPRLLDEFDKGFDLVIGVRSGCLVGDNLGKRFLREILRFLIEYSCGTRIPDVNSGLRVFRKSTIMPYFPNLCDTFSFTTSMTLTYMLTGKFISHHLIDYNERVGSSKVRLFRDSLRTLQYIIELITYYNPLKVFLMGAIIVLVVGAFFIGIAAACDLGLLYILGFGFVLLSPLIFSVGLLAVFFSRSDRAPRIVGQKLPSLQLFYAPFTFITVAQSTKLQIVDLRLTFFQHIGRAQDGLAGRYGW